MKRNRLMKTGLSLLLSVSLLLGAGTAVKAETGSGAVKETVNQTETVVDDTAAVMSSEESEADRKGDAADSEEKETAAAALSEEVSDSAGKYDRSQDETIDTAESAVTEASETEKTEEGQNKKTEDVLQQEDPENTPYEELLSDETLIVVTVEEASEGDSPSMAEEAVEDLSDQQITALEEYIEEQGYAVTTEALLTAAAETTVKTITFNMNGFISMAAEGFGSGYDAMFYVDAANYSGNGNAYCINPAVQAPGSSSQGQNISYTTTVSDYHDPMLLKLMYYGFGGPGDLTGRFASGGPARHILTHMAVTRRAAEMGIPGAGDYTYRANSTAVAKADALYAEIQSQKEILGTVSVLTPVEGQQTILLLAEYSVRSEKMSLTLKKSSTDPSLTESLSLYSLKGAVYDVYSDEALKEKVGSLKTDAAGTAGVLEDLKVGTYYIKESTAPDGFLLDEKVYKVTGQADERVTVTASDSPSYATIRLLLQKIDAETGKENSRLKGAEFTVQYYDEETIDDSSEPERTWVFETDEQGEIYLEEEYKKSGDPLFTDKEGTPILPLGLLTIQETKSPSGYQINDTVYTCSIRQSDNGSARIENLPVGKQAVKEVPVKTELSVRKTVAGSGGNKTDEFHFTLTLSAEDASRLPAALTGSRSETDESGAETAADEAPEKIIIEDEDPEKITIEKEESKEGTAVYSFTLSHGQTMTFRDLPVGLEYEVRELDGKEKGYTVSEENAIGILDEEPVSVSIRNTKETIVPTGAETGLHNMTGLLLLAVFLLTGFLCFRKVRSL